MPHGEVRSRWYKSEVTGQTRHIMVYVPPGYDDSEDRLPSIYAIQGMTGQLDMWRNRSPFRRNFPELVDEAYSSDDPPKPAIVVYVDCWTSLGGGANCNP